MKESSKKELIKRYLYADDLTDELKDRISQFTLEVMRCNCCDVAIQYYWQRCTNATYCIDANNIGLKRDDDNPTPSETNIQSHKSLK